MGDGTTTDSNTPVQVSGLRNVTAIAAGGTHSLALKSDGTVWSWGHNESGELGGSSYSSYSSVAGQVGRLSSIIAIAGGGEYYGHSLAVKSDGTLWAWGENGSGQLGIGPFWSTSTPTQVDINLLETTTTPIPTVISTPTPKSSPTPVPTPSPTTTPTKTPISKGSGIVFGYVYGLDANALRGISVTITGNNFTESTDTDEEGYYEFDNLTAGDYTLTYEKEGYQTQTKDISLKEGEEMEIETVTLEETAKGKISGYVVDIKGDPVESVRLKLKGLRTKISKNESSDKDGFFEFTDLEADTYVISTTKKGYRKGKKTVKLEDGEKTEIEIELRKTSRRGVMIIKH